MRICFIFLVFVQLVLIFFLMNSPIVCDTPETINAYHLLAMKGALKLESIGLRHSRGSVAKLVRATLKAKGKKAPANKTALLAEFEAYLREIGVLGEKQTARDREREIEMRQANGE